METQSIVLVPTRNTVLLSAWFASSAAPHTFPRTSESRSDYGVHIWRLFTGKLGELVTANWLQKSGFLSKEEYRTFQQQSLSIFFGQENVDEFDVKINGLSIDIKTLPVPTHKYLIIPQDQWDNMPKDVYICCKLHIQDETKLKSFITSANAINWTQLLHRDDGTPDSSVEVEILGYALRDSPGWERHEKDVICREKECVRISVQMLKDSSRITF